MKASRFLQLTERSGAPPSVARVGYRFGVITVHGVRTTGKWQKQFGTILSDNLIRPEHVDWDYRFPVLKTKRRAEAAAEQFVAHYQAHRNWELSVSAVGHSFGTLIIGRTLELYPEVRLKRLILSSSILTCDFPWSQYAGAGGQVGKVLNEGCPADPVVPLSLIYRLHRLPTGLSGCHGFSDTCHGAVENIHYRDVGHTKLPTPLHMTESWLPFLKRGKVPNVGVAQKQKRP